MINLPAGLTWIERLAALILTRSPNTSLVMIKPTIGAQVFVAANTRDPIVAHLVSTMEQEAEPPSMMLERLYHAPSHGEDE
jgi:hypothetical protein